MGGNPHRLSTSFPHVKRLIKKVLDAPDSDAPQRLTGAVADDTLTGSPGHHTSIQLEENDDHKIYNTTASAIMPA